MKEKDKEADHNCTVVAVEGTVFEIFTEGIGGAIVGAAVGAVSSPCRDASKRVSATFLDTWRELKTMTEDEQSQLIFQFTFECTKCPPCISKLKLYASIPTTTILLHNQLKNAAIAAITVLLFVIVVLFLFLL